ncbi:phospholipase A2 large subunit-like [Hydractinia symbiolongicarpus]|uniref:phospholipase A2 large subunit-like n=1 Tax=Hydractinia symbiolongicarpus TaxID=13093 RepID=UPI00254CB742|nr:phospholipase A2 large subunit-like [Hydractinia symbiolongicarpus]
MNKLLCAVVFLVAVITLGVNGKTGKKSASHWKPIGKQFQSAINSMNQEATAKLKEQGNRHEKANRRDLTWGIFPGTNWCGKGNVSNDNEDLGYYENVDGCCRTHDKCPRNLVAKESGYGVTNHGAYTISDCECDKMFKDCLKGISTFPKLVEKALAGTVGSAFFDILKMECLDINNKGIANIVANKPY